MWVHTVFYRDVLKELVHHAADNNYWQLAAEELVNNTYPNETVQTSEYPLGLQTHLFMGYLKYNNFYNPKLQV